MKEKYVWRARIVLLAAAGVGTMAIVRQIGKSKRAVWRWQERFVAEGGEGLRADRPRPGRPPAVGAAGHVRGGLRRSGRTRCARWWSARNARWRPTPRTGARAAWPGRLAWARPPSRRSGVSTA